jgi:chemotaxis protein MotB
MKRNHSAPHENHERWLVSYADFITLLFAFFVVMFATTQGDKNKAKQVSDSVKEALEHGELSGAIAMVLAHGKKPGPPPAASSEAPPAVKAPEPADLAKSLVVLQHGLAAEIQSGKIGIKLEGRGLVISLRESTFFASGDDTIAPASLDILTKIALEARAMSNPVRLEGHTDSIPIHNSRFRSNWELSTARAIAMMELLCQRFELRPERMSVAGYAENAPADTNDTAEGRAHNRRVDLVLVSAEGEKNEPKSAAATNAPR